MRAEVTDRHELKQTMTHDRLPAGIDAFTSQGRDDIDKGIEELDLSRIDAVPHDVRNSLAGIAL